MMIDLHSHLLPAIDDGAKDIEMSVEMARIAVSDGITVMACTPHFYPGVYDNSGQDVRSRIDRLQSRLDAEGIALTLVAGGDLRLEPGLLGRLQSGEALALHGTRYALIEPAHQLFTQGMERFFTDLIGSGFRPILTHPERMGWIDQRHDAIDRLFQSGVLMQITAGAVTGKFGRRALYWSERLISEGKAHILASDAHDPVKRPPLMREAFETVADWVGEVEARHMVLHRPRMILENQDLHSLPFVGDLMDEETTKRQSLWGAFKSFIVKYERF